MIRIALKIIITAVLIVLTSEAAKRLPWMGAILASLPLTSVLAMTWLYWDTGDASKVSELSIGIFWAVLPSLLFFLILPRLLRGGVPFPLAMGVSCLLMAGAYAVFAWAIR